MTMDDVEEVHAIHSMPEVDRYNTVGIPAHINDTIALMKPIIADRHNRIQKQFAWIIRLKESLTFIGVCGLTQSADRFKIGEIYYNLLPDYWGHGYATDTAKALISFGFERLKLHRIEAGAAVENERSVRVMKKCGMSDEGIRRKILPIRGFWIDGCQFAILEDDVRDY